MRTLTLSKSSTFLVPSAEAMAGFFCSTLAHPSSLTVPSIPYLGTKTTTPLSLTFTTLAGSSVGRPLKNTRVYSSAEARPASWAFLCLTFRIWHCSVTSALSHSSSLGGSSPMQAESILWTTTSAYLLMGEVKCV